MARPSLKTPEVVAAICERLAQGEPLAVICRDEGMPADRTVRDWMEADAAVSADIARAREAGFDAIAAECLSIADNGSNDTYTRDDGSEAVNSDVVARSKLRVETRLKLLAKWDPRRYGERMTLAGDSEQPLFKATDDQIDARLTALLAKREGTDA